MGIINFTEASLYFHKMTKGDSLGDGLVGLVVLETIITIMSLTFSL